MTWGVPYWSSPSSSTVRPALSTQTTNRGATLVEHRIEWEEISPVYDDHDADVVSLDGSKTSDDMQVPHVHKLLEEAKRENRRLEEQVQSLLNQSMTETSSLQAKLAELRQRNKEILNESERTKKDMEDVAAALTKKNDFLLETLQLERQEMQRACDELNRSTAQAQAELQDAKNNVLIYRRQLSESSAQAECLRKEQTAKLNLTERVAALEAELKIKDAELAESKKPSAQPKCTHVAREESKTLVQEFAQLRALLVDCVPERAGVANTGVTCSSNDIVGVLRGLNSDILQDATIMAESMTESIEFQKVRVSGSEETAIFQQLGVAIGAGLVHFLSTKHHGSDPILIQIAFQAYISQYLCWISTTWVASGSKERLTSTDADQTDTSSTVSAAWSALANILSKHLQLDDAQLCSAATSKIIAGLADILFIAGCNATRSQLCDIIKKKFSQKILLLVKSGLRINKIIGYNETWGLDAVVIKPAAVFDSTCMDNAYDDGVDDKGSLINRVLCPTDIGLWQRPKGSNAGVRILLKPKIALESVVDDLDD